jgi:hypothetical protein
MKRSLITVIVAAIIAALAAIAVSAAAPTPRIPAKPTQSADRRLGSRFSVLAGSSSGAALPAGTATHLTAPGTLVSEFALEPTSAVAVEINDTQAWVIPGRRGICLAVSGVLLTTEVCGPLANADAGCLVMVLRPSSGPVIYGLVPDGASVTVTDTDGSSSGVPVTNNVFVRADPTAQSVSVKPIGGPAMTTVIRAAAS